MLRAPTMYCEEDYPMTNVNNAVKTKLVATGAAFGDSRRTTLGGLGKDGTYGTATNPASIASLKAEVVEKFKPKTMSKAEVLAMLEDKATTLAAHSRTTGIPVEKEGLAYQAHALREAIRLLNGGK
jgi:hypothetical protein